jgi:hypothetical protein
MSNKNTENSSHHPQDSSPNTTTHSIVSFEMIYREYVV